MKSEEEISRRRGEVSGAVTYEWLTQAEAARFHKDPDNFKPLRASSLVGQQQQRLSDEREGLFSVIDEFNLWRSKPELAEAVAAIKALTAVIQRSEATTMMGLEIDLKKASEALKAWDETSISLSAGCDLFMRYVTRTSALEYEDIVAGKARLIERGEKFGEISLKARQTIALLGKDFVQDGSTILTHGCSRVVLALLKLAASNGKHFHVICTEGRPKNSGVEMANQLLSAKIPVSLIIDSAIAYTMEKVDMVLVGADGVVESGGIINMIGTYQAALVAHSMSKPVYVAAESYKFARMYPLDQRDLPLAPCYVHFPGALPESVIAEVSTRDYTPPKYLTLLFTDLGVLTPSAVSDELIQLYL
ncbi:hypothetical protein O6H91_02G133300 [Diphasiastrum complanatum]|uniref:Uncharacterized protein n=3 Tax=Diphasiastrum complanatum TaxID=34168 RepID=A0ACC2EL78_DIPCM|nr:hypothetical protein O6H91_02G133300 [Diphasiastrum complanatum]